MDKEHKGGSGSANGIREIKDGVLVDIAPKKEVEHVHVKSLNAVFRVDDIEEPPSAVFVMVKNSLDKDGVANIDSVPHVNISMEMYVHMEALSDELRVKIREELHG